MSIVRQLVKINLKEKGADLDAFILTVLASTVAGLIVNFITAKIFSQSATDSSSQTFNTININVIDLTFSRPEYVSPPAPYQPISSTTESSTPWFWLLIMLVGVVGLATFYARHEHAFVSVLLVAAGLGTGLTVPLGRTWYVYPQLRSQATWILAGWIGTLFNIWQFLFGHGSKAYNRQLQLLRNSPTLTFIHLHQDILIAYRVMGWIIILVDVVFLLIGSLASILKFTPVGRWRIIRTLHPHYERNTGGLFILIASIVAYALISGLLLRVV